jgi:DNA-binding CsgD family transcriptional regulator
MSSEQPAHPLIGHLMMLERTGQLPVYTTPLLEEILDGRFKETPFFTDVMQPAGMNHIAGLVSAGGTAIRRISVGWDGRRDVEVDDGVLEKLRMVHPAFEAACRLIDQAEVARRALLTTIDGSSDGMALVTAEGTELHRNPSLRRLISIDGESGSLRAEILKSAASLTQRRLSGNDGEISSGKEKIRAGHEEYRARASILPPTFGVPPNTVLVTLSPAAANLPLSGEIQRRFGLTQRQAEVARMVASRLSDAEIAKRLGVSWHTVRSHVDGVLREMGVHSRQEIIDRLLSE